MSKAEKLATKILSGKSDNNFAFNDLCYILERAGFQSRSGKGSHRIYYKEGVVEIVNVQPRNGKAKPYQVKQVRELVLKYKIDIECERTTNSSFTGARTTTVLLSQFPNCPAAWPTDKRTQRLSQTPRLSSTNGSRLH